MNRIIFLTLAVIWRNSRIRIKADHREALKFLLPDIREFEEKGVSLDVIKPSEEKVNNGENS
jgi:hypothetical protein